MKIQSYILPKWKEEIKDQNLSNDLEEKFIEFGESMAEYLDRFMMRSLPENWYQGWTRYKFPLKTDPMVLDIHQIIGKNFGEYIQKYRNGKKEEFELDPESLSKYEELMETYQERLRKQQEELQTLKDEVKQTRESSPRSKERRAKREQERAKSRTSDKPKSEEKTSPETDSAGSIPSHDVVYDKWMEMVETKPISKSYWHIHEYLARYILDFVEENSDDGKITEGLIEDFLVEYGKGKRPKTMNHYKRVIYRFYEFYENLLENREPMEVW